MPGVETELHALFRRELATDGEFGVRDTLIDLGADSLRTANLFLAVERCFGVALPLEAAAEANTIELLALRILQLRETPGQATAPDPSLKSSIARRQLTYLAAWTGHRRTSQSLIVTRGEGGEDAPLFWCFQGAQEHERLSAVLGPHRMVHGMRSGHLLFRDSPKSVEALATIYVQEIEALQPEGSIWLGGNCQGGVVSHEIARQLLARGREVETLFLLDMERFLALAAPVSLIFGSGSEFNPYLGGASPERMFEDAYPAGYSVDFLPGVHGLYFEQPALDSLARIVSARLRAAETTAEPA